MAKKKLKFCVVDTETATLAFANDIAGDDAEKKKRIAIAKPLVYDIGWTICTRNGEILDKKQFLIAETFSVMPIFNTAYYKDKRPIYLEMLRRGETSIKPWNEVMDIFITDLATVDAVGAFNSMFDFKKAIPFTELYINKIYSPDFYEWEEMQYKLCEKIADKTLDNGKKREFEPNIFKFRDNEYILFDLWGLSVTHLLNNVTYKNKCLEIGLLTNSGTFFKTSAESTYQYLVNKYDFVESHTALDDAMIESYILHKIAQKHAITPGIKYFPFSDLGSTYDFCKRRKNPRQEECKIVINKINEYLDGKEAQGIEIAYMRRLNNIIIDLATYAGIPL